MRERIAKAIRDSGKKKSEIADLVGVSTAAVTQWESRETKTLKAENLMALAKATGRSPQWLATGEGPETPSNVEPGPRLRGLFCAFRHQLSPSPPPLAVLAVEADCGIPFVGNLTAVKVFR